MKKNNLSFKTNPHLIFLFLSGVFGFLYLLITPPFQAPDEPSHLFRSLQLSEGIIIAQTKNQMIGGYIPASIEELSRKMTSNIIFHPENKQNPQYILSYLSQPLLPDESVFVEFPNSVLYTPIPYIATIASILITKQFSVSPLEMMYFGRIANLLVYTLIMSLALKMAPVRKWTIMLLALTPMSLFLGASISPDGLTNALAFLLITIFLSYGLKKEQRLRFYDLIILLSLTLVVSLAKQTYFILLFLFFIIPVAKIGSVKKYILWFFVILTANILALTLWTVQIQDIYRTTEPNVNPNEQLQQITQHPENFIEGIFNSLKEEGANYLGEIIGQLGWLDTHLNTKFKQTYGAMLLFLALFEKDAQVSINKKQRGIIGCVAVLSIITIFLLLYLSWTPIGLKTVNGVQGRYFLTMTPLLPFLFYNQRLGIMPMKNLYLILIIVFSLFSGMYTFFTLLQRYYL